MRLGGSHASISAVSIRHALPSRAASNIVISDAGGRRLNRSWTSAGEVVQSQSGRDYQITVLGSHLAPTSATSICAHFHFTADIMSIGPLTQSLFGCLFGSICGARPGICRVMWFQVYSGATQTNPSTMQSTCLRHGSCMGSHH